MGQRLGFRPPQPHVNAMHKAVAGACGELTTRRRSSGIWNDKYDTNRRGRLGRPPRGRRRLLFSRQSRRRAGAAEGRRPAAARCRRDRDQARRRAAHPQLCGPRRGLSHRRNPLDGVRHHHEARTMPKARASSRATRCSASIPGPIRPSTTAPPRSLRRRRRRRSRRKRTSTAFRSCRTGRSRHRSNSTTRAPPATRRAPRSSRSRPTSRTRGSISSSPW